MLDWDDLRFFLAIARQGTLSSAAEDLQVTQSTVGRRLASLEAGLGVRLLNRTPSGYVPTVAGESILEHVKRLEDEALAVVRSVAGHDARNEGRVSVACIESIATSVLVPSFAAVHRQHPEICIELLLETRQLSLSRRDADISVRLVRPTEQDAIVRRIGSVTFGLYASEAYLAEHGPPDFENGCAGHTTVVLSTDLADLPQAQWFAELTREARVTLRTNGYQARFQSAVCGDGLVCLPRFHASQDAGLQLLATPLPAPSEDVWLAIHKDNRSTRRVRIVMQAITAGIAETSRQAPAQPALAPAEEDGSSTVEGQASETPRD